MEDPHMYRIEFIELNRWYNWDHDESGDPVMYDSIEEARLALYEDHLESLTSDEPGNMPLDQFSIVREEGDEPAIRYCLTEFGALRKPIPY